MTSESAISVALDRYRNRWILLGHERRDGRLHPIFSCPCGLQRYTLVTPGATLPGKCPRCGKANRKPVDWQ